MSQPRILGLATSTPRRELPRAEWLTIARRLSPARVDARVLERLADRSGIDTRACACLTPPFGESFYPADDGSGGPTTASRMELWWSGVRDMGERAALSALAQSACGPESITHVVTASCTGFRAPGLEMHLIEALSLPASTQRTNIGFQGCHAAVNALAVARAIVLADASARVLVCCAEVSTAHFHYSDRLDQLIANTLFADGCAACVVGASAGALQPAILSTHTRLFPATAGEMGWLVGDHGFEMMLGARVPELLEHGVGSWVDEALAQHGWSRGHIGGWAIHPGGPRVIDAVLASLALPASSGHHSREVLRRHGNMSSATLLFIVRDLMEARVPRPWGGMAFGPGLAGELLLLA
jgi:predicted naringenin-chalcone synthase